MTASALLQLSSLLDLSSLDPHFVLGGHGYDTGRSPIPEPRGDDEEEGGIGTATIIAVLLLAVGTVALLVWVSPSRASLRRKATAPAVLPVLVIAAPLILWAVFSGEGDDRNLIVERATGRTGAPEFLVSLVEADLNTLTATEGVRAVRVQCRDRDGDVVLDARQRWPFVEERSYEYPHVHQAATERQRQQAKRCRVMGTRMRLEADVEGPLRP
jgi:hypothetical protein